MIAVGNITNEINVNNPFFVSNNIGITAFDMNSKTVREQLQFNPRIGHTEYGAEKVRALNNQEVIIAGWGSKGFKKDLILTKWTLNELVPVQKETISIKNWFYPNKVKWREEVNFNSLVTQLKVFALDGKLVLENEFETKQFTTAHLKKGVFYVSYEVEGNVFTNKLIVE